MEEEESEMWTYREMFEAELIAHGIEWCRGGCNFKNSHKRGFASEGMVHLDFEIARRSTFARGLHEVGHVVMNHTNRRRELRRYEREQEAEAWALKRMRELGVPVSRERAKKVELYVDRMKRWGDASSAGRR